MATHLEEAQRLSNTPYQLGWLIRPLAASNLAGCPTGIHPRFLLSIHQKGSVRSPVRLLQTAFEPDTARISSPSLD